MFIELTRPGGQKVAVNTDQVVSFRDRAGDKPVVILTASGTDFEVTESYEDIRGMIQA